MKADTLVGDRDGGDIVRDVRELAVDAVVLDLPRPPPPASALLDCTNRAVGRREVKQIWPRSGEESPYKC